MKWFAEVKTVEELRKRYRELLRIYHPDNENGSTEITQQINQEYDALFAILSKEKKSDGQAYTYEENERFKAILNEIIGYNMTVEVIGNWLWCFDCYSYKDQLKALGFTWCSKKKAWVWHDEPYHRHHKTEIPLSHIRAKYGCQTVRNQSYPYSLNERRVSMMCLKNCQPVNEYSSPCGSCPEYLNSCMPVVMDGFLVECDLCYCEWCSCYDDCMNGGAGYEITKL